MSAPSEGFTQRLSFALRAIDAQSGAPLPDATVELLVPAAAVRPRLTEDLFWVFVGLTPGKYRVRVSAPAHASQERVITVRRAPTLANAVVELSLAKSGESCLR